MELKPSVQLAKKHQLWLIEDAAHCLGASQNGKALGTFGHFGTLSFHQTKNIHCGEGGALLINAPEFIERAEIIREKGTNRKAFLQGEVDKYSWVDIGSSYLLGEIPAAFLSAQLQLLKEVTETRQKIWLRYHEQLSKIPAIDLPQFTLPLEHNGHIFFLKCSDEATRNNLATYLKKQGIPAYFHYVPLHNASAGQKWGHFDRGSINTPARKASVCYAYLCITT